MIAKYFYRIGHLYAENPVVIVRFMFRIAASLRYGPREIIESPFGVLTMLGRNVKQTAKAFFRGIVVVLVIGVLFGYLMHTVASRAGGTLRIVFDSLLMGYILQELLPLTSAVIVVSRAGTAIAAKFAVAPAMHKRKNPYSTETFHFTDRDIYREVIPQLAASAVTTPVFYGILVLCVFAGYTSFDPAHLQISAANAARCLGTPGYAAFVENGAIRSCLCGSFIGVAASAFGVRASEEYISRVDELFELHDAVWESSVTSLIACGLFLFWKAA